MALNTKHFKYFLIINFNNKISLFNFLKLLKKIHFFNYKIKIKNLKTKKYLVSVLKSPHVNKTAQEQFQKIKYVKIFEIDSLKSVFLFNMLFKKLNYFSFSDVCVKCRVVYTEKPKILENSKAPTGSLNKASTVGYLKLLDVQGEISRYNHPTHIR